MMTDSQIQQIPIDGILPQRPPFVMVSQLMHYDERLTVTRLRVEADNLFCEAGRLLASGLVENVAQTCAARIGYIYKYILHRPISIGYIGAVRGLNIHVLPHAGQTVETRIEVLGESFGLTLVHCEVRLADDGTLLAEGEMKIALAAEEVG